MTEKKWNNELTIIDVLKNNSIISKLELEKAIQVLLKKNTLKFEIEN